MVSGPRWAAAAAGDWRAGGLVASLPDPEATCARPHHGHGGARFAATRSSAGRGVFRAAARISELTGAGEEAAMTMQTSAGNRGRIGPRIAALRGE